MQRTLPAMDERNHAQANDTRGRMIQAAIEVFGALGYDGASTRALADKAGVNLAAIPYHFGGKRALYLAAAHAIADYARTRIDPVIAQLRNGSRGAPAERIRAALASFFHLLAGDTEPEAWTAFFVRCEREADEAFRIIHQQAVARFQRALTETVAEANGLDPDDVDLKMRVAIILASFVNLRTLRNVTLTTLGWARLDADRLARFETTMVETALRELLTTRQAPAAFSRALSA